MSDQSFEIGLVGAGAISAGAYTGGVVDFLVQALDRWYAIKGENKDVPPHDVKISVFSGASAGAMTAALATAYMGSDQPPVTNEAEGHSNKGRNKLFDSWVDRIDISSLLQCADLAADGTPVLSLLDSSVLSDIANHGLTVTPSARRRPYLAENFELILTVTNLRGVPYGFKLIGDRETTYEMSLHADYVQFRINDTGKGALPDRYVMSWADFAGSSPVMENLKLAALASGAFPFGLAPRNLAHTIAGSGQADWYSSRQWPIPTPQSVNPHRCVTPECIPPTWEQIGPDFEFKFQCVDGGVMNNEPLELARKLLAGSAERNARKGEEAYKAILLIDPFPNTSTFDPEYAAAPDLAKLAMSLLTALKNQARFKPDELVLAASEEVYSRFMIAPSRDGERYPIACGSLGGFGGFLKRDFRAHDYFLGRRNGQKFLRDHFVLPERNPLFSGWSDEMKKAYCARDAAGAPKKRNNELLLPIIPLVGEIKAPCYQPTWPRYTDKDLAQLTKQIDKRVDVVLDHLVDQYFKTNHPFVRFAAGLIIGRKKKDIVKYAEERVAAELRKMKLMT